MANRKPYSIVQDERNIIPTMPETRDEFLQGAMSPVSAAPKSANMFASVGGSDLSGLNSAISPTASSPWYQSLATGLTAAAPVIGAATGILDTITSIYGTWRAQKDAEENRKLALKMYEEQKATEAEGRTYERGLTERSWNYKVKGDREAKTADEKEDRYNKYMAFVKNFTNMLNSEPQTRLGLAQAYRSM